MVFVPPIFAIFDFSDRLRRGLLRHMSTILGFRFAPPQALCYRRASRAQCKLFVLFSELARLGKEPAPEEDDSQQDVYGVISPPKHQ